MPPPLFAARRTLTPAEVEMVRPLFRHGLDYAKVRIQDGGWWGLPHLTQAALAAGNTLVFPPRLVRSDFSQASDADKLWLVHELAHVWQWQRGLPLWRHGALLVLRGGYGKQRSAYRYRHLLHQGAAFSQLNMEQQADAIAHYFDAAFLQGDGSTPDHAQHVHLLPHYARLLEGFLADPCDCTLRPASAARMPRSA